MSNTELSLRIYKRRHRCDTHCGAVLRYQQFISVTLIGVVAEPSAVVSSPARVTATPGGRPVVGCINRRANCASEAPPKVRSDRLVHISLVFDSASSCADNAVH
jgi:hypothetical protein